MGIQGKVDVQVTIDEEGKVISARAASGHPFLRGPAETAAWKARFKPTTLSEVPVKVTGVIVYNFTRN
jgi:protein TonB